MATSADIASIVYLTSKRLSEVRSAVDSGLFHPDDGLKILAQRLELLARSAREMAR